MFTSLGVVSSLTFSLVLSLLLYNSVILDIIVIRFGGSDLLMARLADIDLGPSLSAYVFTFPLLGCTMDDLILPVILLVREDFV